MHVRCCKIENVQPMGDQMLIQTKTVYFYSNFQLTIKIFLIFRH